MSILIFLTIFVTYVKVNTLAFLSFSMNDSCIQLHIVAFHV